MLQDEPLLLDILQAASDAIEFVATLDQAKFNASKLHQNAVIRCIEIIGEAAGKVSREFQDAHPEIPWRDITGMRHRLIHNYADVRLDLVWHVSKNKLPELIAAIRPLIPPGPADTQRQ
jgi:uncharacterized protein with HEPN domain